MSEIIFKSEIDNDDNSNDSISELTSLLEEVKQENQTSTSDNDQEPDRNENAVLPESFFDDLYLEEIEAAPAEATTEEDLQKLQEIIAKKKRILQEVDDDSENGQSKSSSQNLSSKSRKRKDHKNNDHIIDNSNIHAKRHRNTVESQEKHPVESNTLQCINSESKESNMTWETTSIRANSPHFISSNAEEKLKNLLQTEDYNSDDDRAINSNHKMHSNFTQQMYGFPHSIPMMFNPTGSQLFPPNMMTDIPMMGYNFSPQVNVPFNDNEVQCLPVSSSGSLGLSKIPFRRIKLEKADKITEQSTTTEDPKKRIIANCTQLLEDIEFPKKKGKFVYISTVTKNDDAAASNSILKKITNVIYNFQCIGSTQNIQIYGLKEIPSTNVEIAKKISMSADKYFTKISQNANTLARKMIKEENIKVDEKQILTEKMEMQELTMSSYFKNSSCQTDPLNCRECIARKRKVGHEIAVQATTFSFSIGTQTTPEVRFNEELTKGLSDNQLKAMYEFSLLIREPQKNTSEELIELREKLINLYNLSQRQYKGPIPYLNVSTTLSYNPINRSDPRINNNHSNSNERRYIQQSGVQQTSMNTSSSSMSNKSPHEAYSAQFSAPNYPQQIVPISNEELRMRSNYELSQNRPKYRQHGRSDYLGAGYSAQFSRESLPEFPDQEFQPETRKKYGRGGIRR